MTAGGALPRVAIIGGGMAGLTTAFELSRGNWRDRYESITVYQRGWRLGGKGASSRGRNSRIEEHGLHVLLGYYHDTFRVMDECYRELNRAALRPHCPILTWEDAVKPASVVGLAEEGPDGWEAWSMAFPQSPGRPGSRMAFEPFNPGVVALRCVRLLAAFYGAQHANAHGVTVSANATPPGSPTSVLRGVGLTALAGILDLAERATPVSELPGLGAALGSALEQVRRRLYEPLVATPSGRVTRALVELAMTNLVGIVRDRLLARPDGLAAIDDLDYREWLQRHGASADTVDSAIVRGMYDLVFAYEGGDPQRPSFSAGLGLQLAARMLFDYEGALFWKMQAGMGEVVFAPLYEALSARGVGFEFFHRLDDVELENGAVSALRMGRQADLTGVEYQPLIDAGGIPAWPDAPLFDQVVGGDWLAESESYYGERRDAGEVRLRVGANYDIVVFAASLGIVPYVASALVEADPRWRAMVDNVATVATQAFQLWLTEDDKALGWNGGDGVTLSGFAPPFDTWASMSHLLDVEDAGPGVEAIAYFCGSMADSSGAQDAAVRARAVEFLRSELAPLWPNAYDAAGEFRWELLADAGEEHGPDRFRTQYWRANTDPSDRYVQSLPGTDRYRLSPSDSGFSNLVIAGDWTDTGLNAGCLEAATRSGIQAARAVAELASDGEVIDD